ncbi:MAG: FtsX-like permease family protein [Bacteroidetes bacterium]|nr:FtsX-like permease family protein [Bacteroidota bacterium]
MFKNNLKIAFRSLFKHKRIAVINVAGLAIGIATCLVIMLFVQHELSYDRFNEKADRIVRVIFDSQVQGEKMNEETVMPPVAQALKSEFPEVEEATRMRYTGTQVIEKDGDLFRDFKVAYADANFFDVFTLPLLEGDAKTVLTQPNMAVISRTVAEKLYGKTDPIGQTISFKHWDKPFRIVGIMEDVPVTSHFDVDIFTSMASLPEAQNATWMQSNFYTYLVLRKNADYQQLETKLSGIIDKYMGPELKEGLGMSIADFRAQGNDLNMKLQPLTSIHLHTPAGMKTDLNPPGDVRYVYIFMAVAIFMLLIACINFMNLSTAGSSKRAKEVGIRKVLGSAKGELLRQFLLESMLMAFISLLLGVVLATFALPLFNQLADQKLSFNYLTEPWLLPSLLLFGVFTGLLAGSYPAFFMSAFQPKKVLKGQTTNGTGGIGLRNGLVVFQFCLSITLMVCTGVVWRQLNFIQHSKLGYDTDAVLIVPNAWALGENENAFRQAVQQDARVLSVSNSGYIPAGPSWDNNMFFATDLAPDQTIKTLRYDVDEQYIPTLGMKLAEGRNFSKENGADSSKVIINEAAAKAFDWQDGALGHSILTSFKKNDLRKQYEVIGVIQDFHFKSLHEQISPLVMTLRQTRGDIIMKVNMADAAGLLSTLEGNWKKMTAGEPFEYSFLDERVYNTYRTERRTGIVLGIFAGLTIFVACLGLLGLAIFTASQRTKEIGIRKVLGASVTGIVGLLSKDFLKLVVLSLVIASPVAYFLMDKWLQDFAYRIKVGWVVFVVVGLAAVVVATFTVSIQSIKAALANPVKSLRSE